MTPIHLFLSTPNLQTSSVKSDLAGLLEAKYGLSMRHSTKTPHLGYGGACATTRSRWCAVDGSLFRGWADSPLVTCSLPRESEAEGPRSTSAHAALLRYESRT